MTALSIHAQLIVLQQGDWTTLAVKRRGVRAATADEVRPSRGVPIEASLGVIETPRIAAAALHVQSTPCNGFVYRITIKMTCTLLFASCWRIYLSLRQITYQ